MEFTQTGRTEIAETNQSHTPNGRRKGNMNKKERKKAQLERHYAALVRLASACRIEKADGKKLSVALLKIEREASQSAVYFCNGSDDSNRPYGSENWERDKTKAMHAVKELFGMYPHGLFINSDARGYALKIDNEATLGKKLIEDCGLQTDWGGYGLLAPEITGN